jgi:hypothetical protein
MSITPRYNSTKLDLLHAIYEQLGGTDLTEGDSGGTENDLLRGIIDRLLTLTDGGASVPTLYQVLLQGADAQGGDPSADGAIVGLKYLLAALNEKIVIGATAHHAAYMRIGYEAEVKFGFPFDNGEIETEDVVKLLSDCLYFLPAPLPADPISGLPMPSPVALQLYRPSDETGVKTMATREWVTEQLPGGGVKVFRAIISQSGTAAPTVVILENSLGGEPVFTRLASGTYRMTLADTFPADKVFAPTAQNFRGADFSTISISRQNDNSLNIVNRNNELGSGTEEDYLYDVAIEILVYP